MMMPYYPQGCVAKSQVCGLALVILPTLGTSISTMAMSTTTTVTTTTQCVWFVRVVVGVVARE
jgi:hypothetical protein